MKPVIAFAQFDPTPGDIAGNCKRILKLMEQAEGTGVELLLFPEEAVGGYCVGDLNRNRIFMRESLRAVEQHLVPASGNVAVVIGLIAPLAHRKLNDGAIGAQNRFVVMQKGKVIGQGAKSLLVDDGVFYDSRYFLPAQEQTVVPVTIETRSGPCRLGIMICHDMWDDNSVFKPSRHLAQQGAELLVVLNSSPFYSGRHLQRMATARQRVAETGLPLAYVNACSVQDNGKNVILFDGGSFLLEKDGSTVFSCPRFVDGLFPADSSAVIQPQVGSETDEILDALLFGLRGFFQRTGDKNAVIGLSGGIDSSLSAALVVAALGPERLLGVNMPTRFSSSTTRKNAAELARRLGIEYIVHPIEEIVQRKKNDYEQINQVKMATLTFENIQARERGNSLMTYAQERQALVIGNGNKTEFQRGYATLYGDIVGALMPLGDLAKTEVYRVAALVNKRFRNPIPEAVITIPPSAELSAAQDIDKGQGDPFDYDVEGPLGQEIMERERSPGELRKLFEQRKLDPELWSPVRSSKSVYDKHTPDSFEILAHEVFRAIESSVFKRIQAPPVVKVSRKAFGFDFREAGFARLKY
jgi:NAD+ synthase (glutamine-hydrolysing)